MTTDTKFSKEITWMAAACVTTGIKQADGTYKYEPKWNVTREAMTAFLYRINNGVASQQPIFTDVKPGDKFFNEIAWLGEVGLSTGIKQADGIKTYAPKWNTTREAMAAFLYRADLKL